MSTAVHGLKRSVLQALYATGAAAMRVRWSSRGALTVLGLHRVLSADDPRRRFAMEHWTLSDDVFRQLLDVVGRTFRLVSLEDALRDDTHARPRGKPPLLLTFDDGWADTADTALPILRAFGFPALTFVVSGRVDAPQGFWDSEWHAALVAAPPDARREALRRLGAPMPDEADLASCSAAALAALRTRPLVERWQLLSTLLGGPVDHGGPVMLRRDQLGQLSLAGVEIGAHGQTHEPLLTVADGAGEIAASIAELAAMLAPHRQPVRSFSFPHGSYDAPLVAAAVQAGAVCVCTSDYMRNRVGRTQGPQLWGRLWPVAPELAASGSLDRPRFLWDLARSTVGHLAIPKR